MVAMLRESASARRSVIGSFVLAVVVAGCPGLLVELERRRLVQDDGRWRQVGTALGVRVLKGRKIDERLEHGARLPPRVRGAVVLRLVVCAAANEGEDFAGPRIDRNQRRLRPLPAPAGQQFVHPRQPVAKRFVSDALDVQIERGMDVDRACCGRAVLLLQLLAHVVDEIRRLGIQRAGHDAERFPRSPCAASALIYPASTIDRSTTLRRSLARSGLLKGECREGD